MWNFYTYSWNNGQTALNISNLSAGQYTVTITDANNCTYTKSANLTEPAQVVVSPVVSTNYNGADISCFGDSDGGATVNSTGGVQPYDIMWNTSETTNSIFSLNTNIPLSQFYEVQEFFDLFYNDVNLDYTTGSLQADKIDYNFETKYFKISFGKIRSS